MDEHVDAESATGQVAADDSSVGWPDYLEQAGSTLPSAFEGVDAQLVPAAVPTKASDAKAPKPIPAAKPATWESSTPRNNVRGKVALVTGGSRGIGRAIVLRLLQDGAKVVFSYLGNHDAAQEVVDEARAHGGLVLAVQADVSVQADVDRLVQVTQDTFGGRIDILVNNAGVTLNTFLAKTEDEDIQRLIDTNIWGTIRVTRTVVRIMQRQKYGHIVCLSSVVGQIGHRTQTIYGGTKAFIIAFVKGLAEEIGSREITVIAVVPGAFFTDIWDGVDDANRQKAVDMIPFRRGGRSEEVAEVVAFAVSDAASYVSGTEIVVDGAMVRA